MAVDKKSQHVGNHGGKYVDGDGLTKQFTYVDHDKKLKVSRHTTSEKELFSIKEQLKEYKKDLIKRILRAPASICPDAYHSFTLRGEKYPVIKWNETMLKDDGVDMERLRTLAIILENTIELHKIII